MNTRTTKIPKECEFLSEVYSELPKNCLFNKGATGAGGTTIALRDNKPTVICVPSIELIHNKVLQVQKNLDDFYPYKLIGVYSKTADAEISAFIKANKVAKVMVTYDSLARIANLIDPSLFNILIDEYHCLFTDYSFRRKAVLTVLNNYKKFKEFTFMSATPIEESFLLEELIGLNIEVAQWENVMDVTVRPVKCDKSVVKTVCTLIERVLKGELQGNYYFFVNSVSFINKMIRQTGLNESNCKVICSEYNKHTLFIKKGKTTDPPKRINFLTKTGFQGCDIMDEEGKICIISDGNIEHTLIDISTQFLQIAGRIRNSKYKDVIFHIYTNTRYSGLSSYKEFSELVATTQENDDKFYGQLQKMDSEYRTRAARGNFTYYLVDEAAGTITLDRNRQKIDLYNYKITNETYRSKVNLGNAYKENGLKASAWYKDFSNPEIIPMDNIGTFKRTVIALKELCDGNYQFGDWENDEFPAYRMAACRTFDFLDKALTDLGFQGIEKYKYRVTNIKEKIFRDINKRTSETSDIQAISKLFKKNRIFCQGSIISDQKFKETLNLLYKQLEIEKKATSKDAETYFSVQRTKRKIDGIQKRCFVIIDHKALKTQDK